MNQPIFEKNKKIPIVLIFFHFVMPKYSFMNSSTFQPVTVMSFIHSHWFADKALCKMLRVAFITRTGKV